MPEIICYTDCLPEGEEQNISFWDLLLNDNFANGGFVCPFEVYSTVGNINSRLHAKQNYEFLLRAALEYPLKAVGIAVSNSKASDANDSVFNPDKTSTNLLWDEFCTDCYVAGKYSKELMENELFNPVVQTLLGCIPSLPNPKEGTLWLEKMLSHAPEFYEIDDDTRPILIYRGDDTCYNQLNVFADELTKALISSKQRVEVFDVSKEDIAPLTRYTGMRFKAIIGIQTYLFSIKMKDKTTNLHDLIIGPKFNMIFDHPVLLKKHIEAGPMDYYLLVHDRNYMRFAKKYYTGVKDCFFLSPGGIKSKAICENIKKKYDISFIGTYYNYRGIILNIKKMDKKTRYIANRFLMEMHYNVNLPAEEALAAVLNHYGIHLSDEEFLELLFELRYAFFGIMYYYREKVMRTLLDSGIEIHVYGSSWESSPFAKHPYLKIHPAVTGDDALKVMAKSRISLNIMAWHKDGFTERIANSMLNGSVVVSDLSTQLLELFENGQDVVLFDLNNLDTLPATIRELLASEDTLEHISQKGCVNALQNHLWDNRAKQLLAFINKLNNI